MSRWPLRLAVFAFGALSLTGAWIIVLGAGFHHSPGRRLANLQFVSGPPAVAMALIQGLAAALAFIWLLGIRLPQRVAAVLAFALVFLPPLLFLP